MVPWARNVIRALERIEDLDDAPDLLELPPLKGFKEPETVYGLPDETTG